MYRPHLFGPSSIHLYGRCGIGQSPQGWATLFGVIIGLSAIAWQARVGFRNIISSPNSGSAEVSPSHLDAKLPPGVEIRSGISGTDLVYDEAASWTNPGGYIQIGFQGLTPGAVYALGCAFMLQSKGEYDPVRYGQSNDDIDADFGYRRQRRIYCAARRLVIDSHQAIEQQLVLVPLQGRDGELGAQGQNLRISRSVGLLVRLLHQADERASAS